MPQKDNKSQEKMEKSEKLCSSVISSENKLLMVLISQTRYGVEIQLNWDEIELNLPLQSTLSQAFENNCVI